MRRWGSFPRPLRPLRVYFGCQAKSLHDLVPGPAPLMSDHVLIVESDLTGHHAVI
jgi:hypothetical protein